MQIRIFEEKTLTRDLEQDFEHYLDDTQNFTKPIRMDELWEMNIHTSEFDEETQI